MCKCIMHIYVSIHIAWNFCTNYLTGAGLLVCFFGGSGGKKTTSSLKIQFPIDRSMNLITKAIHLHLSRWMILAAIAISALFSIVLMHRQLCQQSMILVSIQPHLQHQLFHKNFEHVYYHSYRFVFFFNKTLMIHNLNIAKIISLKCISSIL